MVFSTRIAWNLCCVVRCLHCDNEQVVECRIRYWDRATWRVIRSCARNTFVLGPRNHSGSHCVNHDFPSVIHGELELVVRPFDKTIDQLARWVVEYERTRSRDLRHRLKENSSMHLAFNDSETRPNTPHFNGRPRKWRKQCPQGWSSEIRQG